VIAKAMLVWYLLLYSQWCGCAWDGQVWRLLASRFGLWRLGCSLARDEAAPWRVMKLWMLVLEQLLLVFGSPRADILQL
jgi:hypothetical protein